MRIQWFKNGDHPLDGNETFIGSDGKPFRREGRVVRYFRHPAIPGHTSCAMCGQAMNVHGFIDTPGVGQTVCPGSFVVTNERGEHSSESYTSPSMQPAPEVACPTTQPTTR